MNRRRCVSKLVSEVTDGLSVEDVPPRRIIILKITSWYNYLRAVMYLDIYALCMSPAWCGLVSNPSTRDLRVEVFRAVL